MAKKNDSGLVQDALIPDEMSPLSLLDFNSSCAKIKQAAVDFRRAVNHKMQLETKDAYLDKFHQIDPYTEAVYDTDALAQHIIDCAEVINRLLTYPKDARRAVLYDNLHDSLALSEKAKAYISFEPVLPNGKTLADMFASSDRKPLGTVIDDEDDEEEDDGPDDAGELDELEHMRDVADMAYAALSDLALHCHNRREDVAYGIASSAAKDAHVLATFVGDWIEDMEDED